MSVPEDDRQERLIRNLNELLQELRVAQAGVQILFAFLLSVAFMDRFAQASTFQRITHITTVLLATGAAAFLIARALRCSQASLRSCSVIAPQMPYCSRVASACALHCTITGQRWQIALALLSRLARASPRSRSGWKNSELSMSLHSPLRCQSQVSATGPGSLCTSTTSCTSSLRALP